MVKKDQKNDGASHLLEKAGLKATLPRLAIIAIFLKKREPVNAEYIFGAVKKSGVNNVTVYRTLASFEKAGVIKRVDLRRESVFYELAGDHHHHIVCTGCGRTEDFESCSVGRVTQNVLRKSSYFSSIQEHSLEFFGICTSCAKV